MKGRKNGQTDGQIYSDRHTERPTHYLEILPSVTTTQFFLKFVEVVIVAV